MQSSKSRKKKKTPESSESLIENIALKLIRRDGGTQPRAVLDEGTIDSYTKSIEDGEQFPPVVLFYDGDDYWLADGFHRTKAHELAKYETIKAQVMPGTRRDAILYCVGANATHGLRRSNADKRRAVETLLKDSEWKQWSNHQIAAKSNVSHVYVSNIRNELYPKDEQSGLDLGPGQRLATRGGTTYVVNTSNIGKPASTPKTTRKRQTRLIVADPQPVVLKPKTVKKGETWMLGEHHLLYCGKESTQKFQDMLPDNIQLLLVFPGEPKEWLPSLPSQANSALMFYTPYSEDMHLEQLRSMVSDSVSSTTDADDCVVLINLPDPSLFLLLDGLETKCICAEPDPLRCTDALTAWSVTQKTSQKI